MDNNNNNSIKKNKTKLITVLILLLALIVGIGIYYKNNSVKNLPPQINAEESKCEILDKSVLNTDELKSWNGENKTTKQTATTKDDTYTYALITYGNTTEPDVGICLEKVEYTDSITIKYSIIKGKSTEAVAEYTPEMLLRFKGNDLKLNFEEVSNEPKIEQKEEPKIEQKDK